MTRLTPDEKMVLEMAADRLREYRDLNDPNVYCYGTENLIRDLKAMAAR